LKEAKAHIGVLNRIREFYTPILKVFGGNKYIIEKLTFLAEKFHPNGSTINLFEFDIFFSEKCNLFRPKDLGFLALKAWENQQVCLVCMPTT
jgi:hypothetical protein